MERHKLKTLIVKNGKWIWPDDEEEFSDLVNLRFPSRWRVTADKNETDFLESFLRAKLTSKGYKTTSFVTYDDLSRLEYRMSKLEREMNRIVEQSPVKDAYQVVEDVVSNVQMIEEAKKAYYLQDNNNLCFSVMVDDLSASILEKISQIEISISRKYPSFSIEVEPVLCDSDVLKGSRLILVK
jgi:hypothetical protein